MKLPKHVSDSYGTCGTYRPMSELFDVEVKQRSNTVKRPQLIGKPLRNKRKYFRHSTPDLSNVIATPTRNRRRHIEELIGKLPESSVDGPYDEPFEFNRK